LPPRSGGGYRADVPRPRVLVVIGLVLALAIGAWTVLAPSALPQLVDARRKNAELDAQLARQHEDNARLEAEVRALKETGPVGDAAVEKAARRELGFVRPDELILTGLPLDGGALTGAGARR
jgi:cell division protein FtsB